MKNYQLETDKIISALNDKVPHLLLHACCAPCSSYVLEYLTQYFDISVFFFNPNIMPEEEYLLRREELARLIDAMPHVNRIELLDAPYDPTQFLDIARGLEDENEGGLRCEKCFRLRLLAAARTAKSINADYVTTTLTISPLKNAEALNRIGEEVCSATDTVWLPSDFKKRGGYQRSIVLSKEYGLYRQNFCGCPFSMK